MLCLCLCHAPRERVSWNSIFKVSGNFSTASRSTWACELKCFCYVKNNEIVSHAPRERVSWNAKTEIRMLGYERHAPRERVSWNIPVFGWNIWRCSHAPRERVSWNVDCLSDGEEVKVTLHVSVWVEIECFNLVFNVLDVTLHVSVWVEILLIPYNQQLFWSRSTWACELKYSL